MTQTELATLLGVARQSLNRMLGELQRDGLLRVEGSGTSRAGGSNGAASTLSGRGRVAVTDVTDKFNRGRHTCEMMRPQILERCLITGDARAFSGCAATRCRSTTRPSGLLSSINPHRRKP